MTSFHLHLISDSTGETLNVVSRACLGQFKDVEPIIHHWTLVRTTDRVDEVLDEISENTGFVLFTMVNEELKKEVEAGCKVLGVPCFDLLSPVSGALAQFLGVERRHRPGGQHVLDEEYFSRIEAMHYVLTHDDGQLVEDMEDADVVLLGVSRTSKTPTAIYLANRGLKASNVPIVPGATFPEELKTLAGPLIVGLTSDPRRLVQIRRDRLEMLGHDGDSDYVDLKSVAREVNDALRMFEANHWPVVDVSRKSIEETAATILNLYNRRMDQGE